MRSDDVLMQKVREGEIARLAVLFERHHRALFGYFVRLTGDPSGSEDMVQDVFFRILKYRQSYQGGSPFTAWMYQIARRVHLDGLGRRRSEVVEIDARGERRAEPASAEPGPGERMERLEETALLRRAMAALPDEKREILVLSRYQNLKYEQIAEILECDASAVKVRVFRAVKALGQAFRQLANEKAS